MHGVLEERPDDVLVGVVQLDADDAVQRHGRQVGQRGVGPGDVPGVDDDAPGLVAGLLDEPQGLGERADVRPGEELDPQPGADSLGLGGELGEPGGPEPAVPRAVLAVGGHLEVAGAEGLGGLEDQGADPVGLSPPGAVVPPGGIPSSLEVDDAVVGEQGADAGEAVARHGGRQVVGQQAETGEPRRCRGLDPLAQGDRAAQVRPVRGGVAGRAPAGGEQLVPRCRPGVGWPGTGQPPGAVTARG